MTGVAVGGTTVGTASVNGQFVAVMNPNDLDFGFDLKGQIVDNSFGHKTFELFIGNLKSYLTKDANSNAVPYLTPPTDDQGNPLPNYWDSTTGSSKILNYQSFKDPTQSPVAVVQRLQTIFFSIKDSAGNSKNFAITIYLDPTAPRVGGNSNPSGSVNPSASMISLADQIYIIDLDTYNMINLTAPKKTASPPPVS